MFNVKDIYRPSSVCYFFCGYIVPFAHDKPSVRLQKRPDLKQNRVDQCRIVGIEVDCETPIEVYSVIVVMRSIVNRIIPNGEEAVRIGFVFCK